MDPDLAHRLRRFGEQVDQAAIAANAQRPAPADTDDTDVLPAAVPITAARSNRRVHMITAAAAAAIVVVGGALVTWRIVGESDPGPADSTQATVSTTERTATTTASTTTSTMPTTTVPGFPPGGSSSTSSTSSTTTTSAPSTGSSANAPSTTVACPDYDAYGSQYPIRLCHTGPAVRLIQQHVGAPQVDGLFGPATRQSVRVFQQVSGLNADGLVGPLTWAAMFPDGAPGTDADGDGTVEPWEVS